MNSNSREPTCGSTLPVAISTSPVANGKAFTVTATDVAGNETTVTHHYDVVPYTFGGFIHILLVLALVVLVINLLSGRRVV